MYYKGIFVISYWVWWVCYKSLQRKVIKIARGLGEKAGHGTWYLACQDNIRVQCLGVLCTYRAGLVDVCTV